MVCAPWAKDMFPCLYDGLDHTDCCRSRGVPDVCFDICAGNAKIVDYRHFG